MIFVIWFDFWLLGQYLDSQFLVIGSMFCRFLAFGPIFGLWEDFWLFGRFLAFQTIFVIWFDFGLLGQYLASGSILGHCVDFSSSSGL